MKKILLIDDDINVLNSISLILDSKYELIAATNSVMALNIISRQNIDLILMDINIPDIDGETLITILKKNERWKHIPVIIISGYKKPSSAVSDNVKGFLGKPVKAEDLRNTICGLL